MCILSGGRHVKKAALAFIISMVVMAIFISTAFNIKIVEAVNGENADYSIEHVSHTIEVLYNGYVLINDTVRINLTGQAPSDFLIGFPYIYNSYVLRCIAYNDSDVFPVSLNAPLENRVGFYGAKINFPRGAPQVLTVVFVLSNDLLIHNETSYYDLNFPVFPSLTKPAAICNVSVVLPEGAIYSGGTVGAFNHSVENLPAFTYNASQVTFSLADDKIQVVDMEELKREIRVNEFGEIEGSDTYRIRNKALLEVNFMEVMLPPNASSPKAEDQFGRKLADPEQTNANTNRYKITFTSPLKTGESTLFTIRYYLPNTWITQEQTNKFALNMSLFQYMNYYVQQASVSFVLPEGARILSFQNALTGNTYGLARNVFQEILTVNKQGITSLDSFNVEIAYEYNLLWLSFRPALWVWALSIVGCVIAVVWKRPKVPARVAVPTAVVGLRLENIRSFVDSYEEKRKIISEIESLETRVQKGKIPRRRYKVQRKTLETRLSTLSRSLSDAKNKMRAAGGKYADLMRQLEIAETENNEIEANIKSIETRHTRGELSLEAYRKLLADYQRRKEKAQTAISGILLRLREEIR
jgi:hypothetical protein